jgi:hypothetical protein
VNEKLGKVASLVSDVGTACEDNNLEEDDLPPSLYTAFQTLESYAMHAGYSYRQLIISKGTRSN